MLRSRPTWWGRRNHILCTVAVFIVLTSLDNAAIGLLPPLYPVIARGLSVQELSIGFVTALTILIVGLASAGWGYWGDRNGRKRLLLYGSVLWSTMTLLTGLSQNYAQFLLFQVLSAVGLGCVASLGFSLVGDFISPTRRGLIMSLWGLTQGIGLGVGVLLAGLLGANNWRLPFFLVAGAGFLFSVLYLPSYEPERGRMEPELRKAIEGGAHYDYKVRLGDVVRLATRGANLWLIAQTFTAQLAYGSLIWLPRLFAAKTQGEGYSLETATVVGSLFAIVFSIGGGFSILGGYLGDRWQSRDLRGRALISAIGIWGGIPFYLALFFLPLSGLAFVEEKGAPGVVGGVLMSLFTNPWVVLSFVVALTALAFTSLASPNWFALINDVNLPEHRGSVFGMGTMVLGMGRAVGNGLAGVTFATLSSSVTPPWNYAWGLALFQLFFIPTGLCYYIASRKIPRDIARVRETLAQRASRLAG
ncbi:MAG: MFS transporter [Dehalococcoidia bacterium]|nr:MFS transporter [Dehalococcoidia bacterium]